MSCLPMDWALYTPGTEIHNVSVLYQSMVIPLSAFNALPAEGFFQAPSAAPQCQGYSYTYSGVINTQTPAITKQTSTANMQTPSTKIQTSTATAKLLSAVNAQKPAANTQMLAAIEQMHIATVQVPTTLASPTCKASANQVPMSQPATCQKPISLCPPMPAGHSQSTPLGNIQIRKPGKAISPNPNLGGTAAQFGSLPNG
ncbi:hypothetical protein DSO57_1004263 [Entomophthora muscae]|uniref:Uncharacterized protein n=1 Tax=Entomophthora muscae TaxID=34485 RepID=A0ACC2RZH5_9FUNG|nr:hypothetical protein DSO57_1004263 [Entomophthora muscae]